MRLLTAQKIEIIVSEKPYTERGVVYEGEKSKKTIKGNLQPERNITLLRELYGERVEGGIKIYTKEKLKTNTSSGPADIVVYDGENYEVSQVRKYDTIIPHYKVIAIRKKDELGD